MKTSHFIVFILIILPNLTFSQRQLGITVGGSTNIITIKNNPFSNSYQFSKPDIGLTAGFILISDIKNKSNFQSEITYNYLTTRDIIQGPNKDFYDIEMKIFSHWLNLTQLYKHKLGGNFSAIIGTKLSLKLSESVEQNPDSSGDPDSLGKQGYESLLNNLVLNLNVGIQNKPSEHILIDLRYGRNVTQAAVISKDSKFNINTVQLSMIYHLDLK
jgi:hypothetical protein